MDTRFGRVNRDGTQIAGSPGWRSAALGVGRYQIDFTPQLRDTPTVLLTVHGDGDNVATVESVTLDTIVVRTLDVSGGTNQGEGSVQATEFSFMAIVA